MSHLADMGPVASTTMSETRKSAASTHWVWALPLAALAGLGWHYLSGDQTSRQVAQAPQRFAAVEAVRPPEDLTVGGVDVARQAGAAMTSLGTLLQGVKDRASATSALPKLQDADKEIGRITDLTRQLPMQGRTALADYVGGPVARVNAALDHAVAIPDVAQLLQPTVGQLRGKLDTMAMGVSEYDNMRYFARVPANWLAFSTHKPDVENLAGNALGAIKDFLVAPDGTITAAVLGVGGFLGLGEKEIAVPFSASQIVRDERGWRFVINATPDALQGAPAFEHRVEPARPPQR
jgi:hypothetical protein